VKNKKKGARGVMKKKSSKAVRYNKWGYIFLIPFILVYVVFQLIPLFNTIYNSFFENYLSGLTQIGPNFVGLENYKTLFTQGDIWIYAKNTMILWIMCFVPQIILSLLLGAWFSDVRLKLKGSRFFKTVIYLPNLIMASAFSMLFFTLFSDGGPINSILMQIGIISEPYKFLANTGSARGLIALMNCLMWFGNTTILLMAGMMGIDTSLFEASGRSGWSNFHTGILQNHITAAPSDFSICCDHITDRWITVIRCTADFDQWYR
jgi:cellobiose transport system permease protein